MEVSDKLALDFHTILLSHFIMLLLLLLFTSYVTFRAKKSALLTSYLLLVGTIALWITAKILKTVSPVIELRWIFIVLQYFAIDCLGVCLLLFASVYKHNRFPSKKFMLAISALPLAAFLVVLTNPLHMKFYSVFTIYKDRFGPLFYLSQSIQYAYLLLGVILLSRGYTKQPGFHKNKALGRIFSVFVMLPLLANLYYILFKMDVFPWYFPFPVFDFSPIAASISLILFIIPTLTLRFFDISPVTLGKLYDLVVQGLLFIDHDLRLYGSNQPLRLMLSLDEPPSTLKQLLTSSKNMTPENKEQLHEFLTQASDEITDCEMILQNGRQIHITKQRCKHRQYLLCISDVSEISKNKIILSSMNKELEDINLRLNEMADTTRKLAIARTKSQMAQNVHDILGHSLTVVIGTAELAAEDTPEQAKEKAGQIEELLTSSLNDIKNALRGNDIKWGKNSLINALEFLKNDKIQIEIQIQGLPYELNTLQTEAVYRLCQEAVTNAIKHGEASTIYTILRYQQQQLEIYAIDNGRGCSSIKKSYGLSGIEERILMLSGKVDFNSDGEKGFTIHAILPK